MKLQHVSIHGHKVGFRTVGEGPVVLLVHGMAGSAATWKHIMPALAQRFTVLAPDLLGHGESAKPRHGEYSLGAQANFLRDLLQVLRHERATFVGQSLGGGVAMQLAYQFPERCERLVLVGSGGLGPEVSRLLRALALPGAEYVLPLVCRAAFRETVESAVEWLRAIGIRPTAAAEEILRGYASLTDPQARAAFFRTLRAVVGFEGQRVSATDRLRLAADLPTLIVWGARDPIIPVEHAHHARAAIPGSRLAVFEDVGHFPHREAPERFATMVGDFVASTTPACLSEARLREHLGAGSP